MNKKKKKAKKEAKEIKKEIQAYAQNYADKFAVKFGMWLLEEENAVVKPTEEDMISYISDFKELALKGKEI